MIYWKGDRAAMNRTFLYCIAIILIWLLVVRQSSKSGSVSTVHDGAGDRSSSGGSREF